MRPSRSSRTPVSVFILCSALLQFACASSDEVTVYLLNGTMSTGTLVAVSDTTVTLPGLPIPAPELGIGYYRKLPRSYPVDKIERVTVMRADPDASGARTLGIVGGVIAGAVAGGAIAQGRGGYLDFDFIPGAIIGGGLGGLLGAVISGSVTMDTVALDPKIRNQRDSLRPYVSGE
jgi:hypothetical protein